MRERLSLRGRLCALAGSTAVVTIQLLERTSTDSSFFQSVHVCAAAAALCALPSALPRSHLRYSAYAAQSLHRTIVLLFPRPPTHLWPSFCLFLSSCGSSPVSRVCEAGWCSPPLTSLGVHSVTPRSDSVYEQTYPCRSAAGATSLTPYAEACPRSLPRGCRRRRESRACVLRSSITTELCRRRPSYHHTSIATHSHRSPPLAFACWYCH